MGQGLHRRADDPTGYLLPIVSPSVFSLGQFRESVYDHGMFLVERFGTPLPDPPISLMSVEKRVDVPKVRENGRLFKAILCEKVLTWRWRVSSGTLGVGSMTERFANVRRRPAEETIASRSSPRVITISPLTAFTQPMRTLKQSTTRAGLKSASAKIVAR